MRTVIIGGAYRAGKSRLANLVFQATRCTVVHLDAFSNAVQANYPAATQTLDEEAKFRRYCNTVLVKAIRNLGKEFNYLRVYDSASISPDLIRHRLQAIQPVALFLGYPNVTTQQKLVQVRASALNDPCCWSHGMKDTELMRALKGGIDRSQRLREECLQHGFPFFDVSQNWQDTINEAYSYILNCTIDSL